MTERSFRIMRRALEGEELSNLQGAKRTSLSWCVVTRRIDLIAPRNAYPQEVIHRAKRKAVQRWKLAQARDRRRVRNLGLHQRALPLAAGH